jgi:hypothetical protein
MAHNQFSSVHFSYFTAPSVTQPLSTSSSYPISRATPSSGRGQPRFPTKTASTSPSIRPEFTPATIGIRMAGFTNP